MATIEKSASIMIRGSVAEIFNFVADPSRFQLWQPFVVEAELTSGGPMRKGSTYCYTFEAMGQKIESAGVITEHKAFRHYAYQSTSGPFPFKGGFTFEEVDEFVKVTAYGEAEPGGYFSMAKPMIGLLLGRQINTMLRTLKDIIEKGGK